MTALPDSSPEAVEAFVAGKLRDVRRGPYRLVKSGGLVGRKYWVRCIDTRHKPGSDDRIVFDLPVGWSVANRRKAVARLDALNTPTAGQSGTTKEEPVTTEAPATPDAPADAKPDKAKPAKGKAEAPRLRSPLGVCPGTGQKPSKALGTRAVPKSKQRYTGGKENGPWGECPVCGHAKPVATDGTVVRHRITEAVATKLGTSVLPKQRGGRPAAKPAAPAKGKTKAKAAKPASKPAAAAGGKPQPKPRTTKPRATKPIG